MKDTPSDYLFDILRYLQENYNEFSIVEHISYSHSARLDIRFIKTGNVVRLCCEFPDEQDES